MGNARGGEVNVPIDWSRVRGITFDAGGTLLAPWPSVGDVYAEVARRHGVNVEAADLTERFRKAWRGRGAFQYALKSWEQLVDETFEGLCAPPSGTFFPELYEAFAKPAAWRVYDDVWATLEGIRDRGLPMAIISNWDERLLPLLKKMGLAEFFSAFLISNHVGACKPDPKIFQAASMALNVPAANLLHVGDSQSEDFDGSRAAGFQGVLVDYSSEGLRRPIRTVLSGLEMNGRKV
jgi:putative hydrolase of the HAD superfamily